MALLVSAFVVASNIESDGRHWCKWDLPNIGAIECTGGTCYLFAQHGGNEVCIGCTVTSEASCIVPMASPPNPPTIPDWYEWKD